MKHHCHIQCTVIQRSRGHSALRRLAYQSCSYVNNGARRADYREYVADHRGSVMLLPEGAPAKFADLAYLIPAIAAAETRADAQEGRALDFAIPRAAPDRLSLPIAAFVLAPFARMGMAIRVDIECPSASDGGMNPHAHCYLSQRILSADGFGKKEREWNRLFRRDGGRHIRALIAGRLTLACMILGVAAHTDPRRNDEIGAGDPEARLPSVMWRMRDSGRQVDAIQKLNARRRTKAAVKSENISLRKRSERCLFVTNAVSPPSDRARRIAAMKVLGGWARARNIPVDRAPSTYGLRLGSGKLTFDGNAFRVVFGAGPSEAALVIESARALEWPALVVDGDNTLTDLIVVAGASEGLAAVNRSASPAAIALIAQRQFDDFRRQIAPYDPSGQVFASLEDSVPKRVVPPAGESEILPNDWQSQPDSTVRSQNEGFGPRKAGALSKKPDKSGNGTAKQKINTHDVSGIRRESFSASGGQPDLLHHIREDLDDEQVLERRSMVA